MRSGNGAVRFRLVPALACAQAQRRGAPLHAAIGAQVVAVGLAAAAAVARTGDSGDRGQARRVDGEVVRVACRALEIHSRITCIRLDHHARIVQVERQAVAAGVLNADRIAGAAASNRIGTGGLDAALVGGPRLLWQHARGTHRYIGGCDQQPQVRSLLKAAALA